MAKKPLTSPKGIAVYPHLNKPDTKFKKDYGEFHVKLRLDAESPEAKKLMAEIDAAVEAQYQEIKQAAKTPKEKKAVTYCEDKPYQLETDDDDEPTGTVSFTFKMNAGGKTKKGEVFSQRPALFNAAGAPLPQETKIGGGSVLKVSYDLYPFYTVKLGAGVSLRMRGVQVLELVEWGGGNAAYHGFEAEDSGETAAETQDEQTDTESVEAGAESDDF